MADLTTVANVKAWLPVVSAADDTLLATLVSGVSAWIQEWLGRIIATASYTETLNGTGKDVLFFMNYPVTAVASVTVDGVNIPARTAIGGSGYTFDNDCLYLDGYCFTRGRQNVVVQYSAGFASAPADLELACKKLCALGYKEREHIGLSSKGLSGEQTNYITKNMPDDVRDILWSYKRVVPSS